MGRGGEPTDGARAGAATPGTAGAAGTALFVTVFAMQTAAAEPIVGSHAEAMLAGSHWAFLGAGAVWTAALICGFFLRRPAGEAEPAPVH